MIKDFGHWQLRLMVRAPINQAFDLPKGNSSFVKSKSALRPPFLLNVNILPSISQQATKCASGPASLKILKVTFANYTLVPIFAVLFALRRRKILKNKHKIIQPCLEL